MRPQSEGSTPNTIMLLDRTAFIAILAAACLAVVALSFILARYAPRGVALFVPTALMAVGLAPMFDPWRNLAQAGTILRTTGFVGMLCGLYALFHRLLIIQSAAPESGHAAAAAAADAASANRPRTRPTPGFWAAVAWCMVLFTGLELMPRFSAEVIAAADFRKVVRDVGFHGQVRTAIRTDLGAARSSGRHDLVHGLSLAVASAVAIALACLLLAADAGPDWHRAVGIAWPRPLQVPAALVGGAGLWILFAGLDTALAGALAVSRHERGLAPALRPLSLPMALAFGGLIPAVVQELWFRAFIGRGLTGRLGTVLGILVTSCLCAMTRLDMRVVILGFALGVSLHLAYLASGSLPVAILIHACVSVGDIVTARSPYPLSASIGPLGYLAAVILVLTTAVLLYRQRPPRPTAALGG